MVWSGDGNFRDGVDGTQFIGVGWDGAAVGSTEEEWWKAGCVADDCCSGGVNGGE